MASDEPEDDDGSDPFERFEGYEDREGDPFAHLDSPDADSPTGRRDDDHPQTDRQPAESDPQSAPAGGPGGDEPSDRDPFEYEDGDAGGDSGDRAGIGSDGTAESDPEGDPGTDPFEGVDPSRGDPFEAGASAFEQVDVDGVDPDDVWAQFTDAGAASEPEPLPEDEEDADDVEDEIVEVPKHSFCEGCEHFSPPPEVRCTHQGTSILEFVDMETVRVANCPVVEERRALGGFDTE